MVMVKKTIALILLFCFPVWLFAGVNYDGTDDQCKITGLMGTPTNITISIWANLEAVAASGAELFTIGDYVILRLDDDFPSLSTKGTFYQGSSTWNSTSAGETHVGTGWHHFLYYVDDTGDSQKIYVDGVEKGASTVTNSIVYTGQGSDTFLGMHGNDDTVNYNFNGSSTEVAVWSVAITDLSEISLLASSRMKGIPLQVQPSSLILYIPFDSVKDGVSADAVTFKDESGSGNDAVGIDGANNTGLTGEAELILSYP